MHSSSAHHLLCHVSLLLLSVAAGVAALPAAECPPGVDGVACVGVSVARNVVSQLSGEADDALPVVRRLWEGVELVRVDNSKFEEPVNEENNARDLSTSLLNSVRKLAAGYEVRLKLQDFVNGAITDIAEARKGGFGGGKKKDGGAMMMAMMMAGMMKAMALGALGLLAMKALTVSSLAFLLSAIVGLKKLLSKGDDGGHHEVVQVHGHHDYHHRRAMDLAAHDLAYKGQKAT